MDKSSSKNVIAVLLITLFSKVLALLRQSVLTYFYGATSTSDAFIIAQTIPNTLFLLVISAIGISFIPVYNDIEHNGDKEESNLFVNHILQGVFILASVLTAIVFIFTDKIVFLFASGFDNDTFRLTCSFLRISIFSLFFIGWFGVFSAFLKANKKFFASSITGISLSLVEICFCSIAFYVQDVFLAIGITVASFSQFLIVFISAKKNGFSFVRDFRILDKNVKRVLLLSIPIFISYGIDEINVIIDKTIASSFDSGSVSMLNYSSNLVALINSTVTVSFYTVLFSDVSKYASNAQIEMIGPRIKKAINKSFIILFPATIGLMLFSFQIISLLYERGTFTRENTLIVSSLLIFYSISIIPNGIRMLVQTYYYSFGRTLFCMIVGIIAVVINIVGDVLLSKVLGLNGLALASSIAIAFSCIAHYVFFRIQYKKLYLLKDYFYILRIAICAALMGLAGFLWFKALSNYNLVLVTIFVILFSVVFYFGLCILFKVVRIDEIKSILKRTKEK